MTKHLNFMTLVLSGLAVAQYALMFYSNTPTSTYAAGFWCFLYFIEQVKYYAK